MTTKANQTAREQLERPYAEHRRQIEDAQIPRGHQKPHTWRGRCLRAVADIEHYARSGDEALAREARRTLDEMCWSSDGYPPFVVDTLRRAGLRTESR